MDLSVTVTNKLLWTNHCDKLAKNANPKLALLMRTFHFSTNKKQKRAYYLTVVRSRFNKAQGVLQWPQFSRYDLRDMLLKCMILFLAVLNYFPDVLKYLSVLDCEWIFIFFRIFQWWGKHCIYLMILNYWLGQVNLCSLTWVSHKTMTTIVNKFSVDSMYCKRVH